MDDLLIDIFYRIEIQIKYSGSIDINRKIQKFDKKVKE